MTRSMEGYSMLTVVPHPLFIGEVVECLKTSKQVCHM